MTLFLKKKTMPIFTQTNFENAGGYCHFVKQWAIIFRFFLQNKHIRIPPQTAC